SRIVSIMSASNARVRSETISCGSSSRARCRRIGSPIWAILRMAMAGILTPEAAAPGNVGLASALIAETRQREQRIAQPLEVHDEQVAHRLLTPCADDHALGATADRARVMQRRGPFRSAGEHERPQRSKLALGAVDRRLERQHLVGSDLSRAEAIFGARRTGELCAEAEQIVLDLREQPIDVVRQRQAPSDTDDGVQLVDRAV